MQLHTLNSNNSCVIQPTLYPNFKTFHYYSRYEDNISKM